MTESYLLGIDVGGTSIKMAIFSNDGDLMEKWSIATNKEKDGEYILEDISVSVKEKWQEMDLQANQFIGAGVGVPGFVDIEHGTIDFAVNIGWRDYPISSILSQHLGLPVVVDNDANLAAAGEYWRGAGVDAEDLILLTLGTGVGGGIIVKGDILHGVAGMAGEIGHVTMIPEAGSPCNCGKSGCLETVASATGMVRMARETIEHNTNSRLYQIWQENGEITTKDIFACAENNDTEAVTIINNAMYYLGLATANIANVLNPEKIVIGGGVSGAGEDLLRPLRFYYDTYALPKVKEHSTFAVAELGNDAGVAGAAWAAKTKAK
ncbi:ROK family protein [Salibacterium salarium]|uniref:Glucokinase n=1 Tax=Salibacterium salarium TaxID=284579 RepID=A0A428MXW3_9BACI|nr:ROK family glucokinase [Salibacterium salarium]RSL30936.1 ROK family protein [Salibacterium salarium]